MARQGSTLVRVATLFVLAAVLSESCAEEPQRIVGGKAARIADFYYQVSLQLDGEHFCGGSIIGPRTIVTAAHCIYDIPRSLFHRVTVVTGTDNLLTGGQRNAVKNMVYHPEYSNRREDSWVNDIAVITLAKDIQMNSNQNIISLPMMRAQPGALAVISGFGRISANGPISTQLKSTPMRILDNTLCSKYHNVYSGHLCAYLSVGNAVCSGDSGGPLVSEGQLKGVVSFSVPCALGVPDVYTDVSKYVDWILSVQYSS